MWPLASRTVAVSVRLPVPEVVHGIETGPRTLVVLLPTVLPFTLRVKVLDDPLVPSAQSTTQAVPRRLAPPVGWVMNTFTAELLGAEGVDGAGAGAGGGADPLLPVTVKIGRASCRER